MEKMERMLKIAMKINLTKVKRKKKKEGSKNKNASSNELLKITYYIY